MKLNFCTLLFLLGSLASVGQDLRNDTIDLKTFHLRLDLTDFNSKNLLGEATIGVKSKQNNVHHIRLDLLKLTVDSVKQDGNTVAFTYNDTILVIEFTNTLNINDSSTLSVYYHGTPYQANGDFGGFYWTNLYAFNIGVSFLADPHNYGRVWFPCFDNFTQRSLYSFSVITNSNQKAFCNGLLQSDFDNGNNTHTWNWKLNQTIPSYLASVTVADYQTLSDTLQGMNGIVPVLLAARAADTTSLKNSFQNLKKAFHIYEDLFGAYPFDRVGYCIVPFNAGAMEHATNISYMQALVNGNTTYETTMAHELSHHWFGDLATCDKAEEMWLNEGWAVYCEHLFTEKMYGADAYKKIARDNHEAVLRLAHVNDNGYYALNQIPTEQTYGSTVYDKGADVAHSLRAYTDSTTFFHCIKNYLSQYSFKDVNSSKFKDYMVQCAGLPFNDAFEDWVFQPGFAHFSLEKLETVESQSGPDIFLQHRFIIRQRLNHANQYYNSVPVTVSYFNSQGGRHDETVIVSGECTEHTSQIYAFENIVYIALDFDEKIQDAVTDEWKKISSAGSYNFGTAKMIVTVGSAPSDTVLLRVEHNWVPAERMSNPIPGLFLHDYRYWKVDGINLELLEASARLDYNGSTNTANGYLDNSFFSNSEDSLVLMYRLNSESEWSIADSFVVNKQGSATNKIGFVTVSRLKKGEYCFAIWDYDRVDTLQVETNCEITNLKSVASVLPSFKLFPNPSNGIVKVEYGTGVFDKLEVVDILGRHVLEEKIERFSTQTELHFDQHIRGNYLITLTNLQGEKTTKILALY